MASSPRSIRPAPVEAWSEVVAEDPSATVMQTPAWFRLVRSVTGGADASRLYELPDGRRLVLPLVRRRWLPGVGTQGAYPKGWGLGGLLATDGLTPDDVRLVLEDLRRSRSLSSRLTAPPDMVPIWRAGRIPGVVDLSGPAEVLDLDGGIDVVWHHRYRSSVRGAIRKARDAGVVIERDTSGRLVADFYRLYLTWSRHRARDRGIPDRVAAPLARRREPARKFVAAAALPDESCRLWMAYVRGRPAAAVITLVYGRYAFYWRAYSDRELTKATSANHLLQHLAIEDACEAGCRFYNMGESGGVDSLRWFKQSFGAATQASLDFRLERVPMAKAENFVEVARTRTLQRLARLRERADTGALR